MFGFVTPTATGSLWGKCCPRFEFLAALASEGLTYRSINTFRSAISSSYLPIDGHSVGEHPLVCNLPRVIRLSVLPEPRYTTLWDVNKVLGMFVMALE